MALHRYLFLPASLLLLFTCQGAIFSPDLREPFNYSDPAAVRAALEDFQKNGDSALLDSEEATSLRTEMPVEGHADIHVHQMGEYAFGGAWFHGKHQGAEHSAMAKCSGGSLLGGDHARTKLGPLNEIIGQVPGSPGDTGWHFGKKNGFPLYDGWPRWDTIAHQQVWEGFLKEAFEEGLSLYFMSAVNFNPLCKLMPKKNKDYDCDDMHAVDRQILAAHRFAEGRDWIEVAYSPLDARRIINEGKMAMVLSIEVTNLFNSDDWSDSLDYYYDLGVRSIQVTHQLDNRFSGAAPHHFIFKFFQVLDDINKNDWKHLGFDLDEEKRNKKGLTAEGEALVRAMMDKKMFIDLAHLPEKTIGEIYQISVENSYYPLNVSHGHFRTVMLDKKQEEEKTVPDEVVGFVRQTGGVFGLRSGPEQVKTFPDAGVPNDCDGSSKSFAQLYQYGALNLKVNMTFATDLNGFIQQSRPRFGDNKMACGASGNKSRRESQQAAQSGGLGTDFDTKGLGHIGMLEDLLLEMESFGVDMSNIRGSAEQVVRTWERAYAEDRQAIDISDMKTGL